jgi:hypothetical protein
MGVMKMATHFYPVQVIKCVELYCNFAMCLHAVVPDEAQGNFNI